MQKYIDEFIGRQPRKHVQDDEIPLKAAIEANHIIDKATLNEKVLNTNEYFLLFSALNLMNAYVKKAYAAKEFKHNYEFKSKAVKRFVENILLDKPKNIKVGGDSTIVYVNIYGVQFSFHHIGYSELISKQSRTWPKTQWSGFRLQPIANQLFELASKYYKLPMDGKDLANAQ